MKPSADERARLLVTAWLGEPPRTAREIELHDRIVHALQSAFADGERAGAEREREACVNDAHSVACGTELIAAIRRRANGGQE